MQTPNLATPIARCESASLFAQQALRRFPILFESPPETRARLEALATSLETATRALAGAQSDYRASVLAVVAQRVEVKLVDLKADDLVRGLKRAADDAGKATAEPLFPGGVTPIVRPVGQTQVDELRALEGRLAASRLPAKEAALARLQAARTEYEAALAGRKTAMTAAADKRAVRDAAKEDCLDVVAAVAGAVREAFPRDRARQDVFFDELRAARTEPDTDEPDEPSEPAPS